MTSSSADSRPVVVDANLALAAVLPLSTSSEALQVLTAWADEDRPLLAPDLWTAEVVSAIRKLVFGKEITAETAESGIGDLFELGVEVVSLGPDLCRAALRWAERLSHSKAYDGFYLALAEERGAELWTVDGRLVRRARQLDADWVHQVAI